MYNFVLLATDIPIYERDLPINNFTKTWGINRFVAAKQGSKVVKNDKW